MELIFRRSRQKRKLASFIGTSKTGLLHLLLDSRFNGSRFNGAHLLHEVQLLLKGWKQTLGDTANWLTHWLTLLQDHMVLHQVSTPQVLCQQSLWKDLLQLKLALWKKVPQVTLCLLLACWEVQFFIPHLLLHCLDQQGILHELWALNPLLHEVAVEYLVFFFAPFWHLHLICHMPHLPSHCVWPLPLGQQLVVRAGE